MKNYDTNKNNIRLGAKLFAALVIFIVVAAYFTGATYAWFANTTAPLQNVFTAGTVDVDLDPAKSYTSTLKGNCREYKFNLKNIGTKSSFVRVKVLKTLIPADSETAWALGGENFEPLSTNYVLNSFRDNDPKLAEKWGWYFTYSKGQSDITRELWAGAGRNDLTKGYKVGTVTVNTDFDNDLLEVTYEIDNKWNMSEAHLYVGNTLPPSPVAQELFENVVTNDEETFNPQGYTFFIPFTELVEGQLIYIAAHAVVAYDTDTEIEYFYQPSSLGDDCLNHWFWHETNVQEGDDVIVIGYWYYWDQSLIKPGNESEPGAVRKVSAEEQFTLCLLMCPLGSDNENYDFQLVIESVQTTHGAIKTIWPPRVWQNLPQD